MESQRAKRGHTVTACISGNNLDREKANFHADLVGSWFWRTGSWMRHSKNFRVSFRRPLRYCLNPCSSCLNSLSSGRPQYANNCCTAVLALCFPPVVLTNSGSTPLALSIPFATKAPMNRSATFLLSAESDLFCCWANTCPARTPQIVPNTIHSVFKRSA